MIFLVAWARSTGRLAVILSVLLASQVVAAQQYGRWWWEVLAGLSQRDTEATRDGVRTSSLGSTQLKVSAALNGFIVDPAIASFRVVLDTLLSESGSDRERNDEQFGLGGEISAFPRGKAPFRLYARHVFFAFEHEGSTDPLLLLRQPDTGSTWGGDLRVMRGAFRGVRLTVEQSNIEFVDPAVGRDSRARQSFEWERGGRRFRHRLRVDNSYWDSALSPVDQGELKILIDEGATLDTNWRWHTYATGLRRTLESDELPPSETDFIDVRNRVSRLGPGRDELVLRYDFRTMAAEAIRNATSNQVGASYRWNASTHWQVQPFAQVTDLAQGDSSTLEPRVGVSANWNRSGPMVQVTLSPVAGYGRSKFESPGSTYEQSNLLLALGGVVGAGETRGLRKEFEFEISRNDLRLLSEPIEELPDLGVSSAGLGVYDLYRGRLTLRHHWDGVQFDTWANWQRTEQSAATELDGFTAESLTGNLEFTGRRGGVTASVGRTEAGRDPGTEQEAAFYGVGATYRPWRHLQLHAQYGKTKSQVLLAPDIDGVNYRLGLRYQWGRVHLGAEYFHISDRSPGKSEFGSSGFQWTLSSGFSGWLPTRSTVKRRGVIR